MIRKVCFCIILTSIFLTGCSDNNSNNSGYMYESESESSYIDEHISSTLDSSIDKCSVLDINYCVYDYDSNGKITYETAYDSGNNKISKYSYSYEYKYDENNNLIYMSKVCIDDKNEDVFDEYSEWYIYKDGDLYKEIRADGYDGDAYGYIFSDRVYDKYNNLIITEDFDYGPDYNYEKHYLDDAGREYKCISYFGDQSIFYTSYYKYDKNMITCITKYPNGEESTNIFKYDDKGNICLFEDNDNETVYAIEYLYDDKGNIIEKTGNFNGKNICSEKYEYKNNVIARKIIYGTEDVLSYIRDLPINLK